jgi:hypothetical protein
VDWLQIYDQQGQEQDWDWLVANFGNVRVERAEVPEGVTEVFRIVKLQDRAGPAVQVVNVSDPEGSFLEGIRVVRYWPDAPGLPAWSPPISLWHEQGVFGATNKNGDIGFGMGRGDYYFAPQDGVSSVWVADVSGPSDVIKGLGMLGGTNHRHLDVYFQVEVVEEAPPEEPPEEPPEVTVTRPPDDRWQMLIDKLDMIITMLEERVG